MNLVILYLIRRYSRKELGQYKNILTIFAAYDFYLCTLHGITSPVSWWWLKFRKCVYKQKGIVVEDVLGVVTVGVWQGMVCFCFSYSPVEGEVTVFPNLSLPTIFFNLSSIRLIFRD